MIMFRPHMVIVVACRKNPKVLKVRKFAISGFTFYLWGWRYGIIVAFLKRLYFIIRLKLSRIRGAKDLKLGWVRQKSDISLSNKVNKSFKTTNPPGA